MEKKGKEGKQREKICMQNKGRGEKEVTFMIGKKFTFLKKSQKFHAKGK